MQIFASEALKLSLVANEALIHEVVHMIKSLLSTDRTLVERTTLSVDNICDLLSLVLTNTYFSFNGKFYIQKFGTSLAGSPVSHYVALLT